MENETNYRIIDFDTWDRADRFRYFLGVEKCIITLTADVDVTELVTACKKHRLKFYTAFLCLVSFVLNQKEHFRFGYDQEGRVVVYDRINPFYTDSIHGGEGFNCIVSDYDPDMGKLYERITADRARFRDVDVMYPDNVTDNIFSVTALPSVHYTQLGLNDASHPDSLAPAIAIGKYEQHEGKLRMPLTLWIHHAVCDGPQVGQFFADMERQMPRVLCEIINGR